MNEHDPMPHDERISALYQMGEGREPPAHLEQAIRQAALREIRRRRQRIIWPSLATAAVLVLSFTLVLQVRDRSVMDGVPTAVKPEPAQAPSPLQIEEGNGETPTLSGGASQGLVAPQHEPKPETDKSKVLSEAAAPEVQAKAAPAGSTDAESDRMADSPAIPEKRETQPSEQLLQSEAKQSRAITADETDIGSRKRGEGPPEQEQMNPAVAGFMAVPECTDILPGPDATQEEWDRSYVRLLAEGKSEQANCLREQFRLKFGRDLQGDGVGVEKPDP